MTPSPRFALAAISSTFALLTAATSHATSQVPNLNLYGGVSYLNTKLHNDPNKPAPYEESFFTTQTEATADGVKLTLEMWHGAKNDPVSVWILAGINDGKGEIEGLPFLELDDKVADNPHDYHSVRTYQLTYQQLNDAFKKVLPPNAQHLKIGPGAPLFVLGVWDKYKHRWGGVSRGGIFFMPDEHGGHAGQASLEKHVSARATDLDLAFQITNVLSWKYNSVDEDGEPVGLKLGGQIKSRLESEGKYQIPLKDVDALRARLFHLANDKVEAEKVFGPGWKIEAEMRYMQRDGRNQLILDSHGQPIPDPMIDTYYDSMDSKGAQNDIAIRWRMTKGNEYGAWNYKPGMTHVTKDGIANRLEYSVDATDDRPESIMKFANSSDPINVFSSIRETIPGAKPSDFLHHSLRVNDTRYKFKLKHKSGLVIEVSLDDVMAESLRISGKRARFVQLEMDVDHPSTASENVAQSVPSYVGVNGEMHSMLQTFMDGLTSDAFLDGRPVIHTVRDLKASSPINVKLADDMALADDAIIRLRNDALGANWLPAPQKASLASFLLEHVDAHHVSPSVRKLQEVVRARKANGQDPGRMFENHSLKIGRCRALFR